MSASDRYDIAVVGGGLVGLASAVIAARTGASTLLLAPEGPADRRTSALMQPSVEFLIQSGLIDTAAEHGHPLTQIRIIDATSRLLRAPETVFDSLEAGLPQFGWNLPNTVLLRAFKAVAAPLPSLHIEADTAADFQKDDGGHLIQTAEGRTVHARLVVGADGKKSAVRAYAAIPARERKLEQSALVCDLTLERPIGGTSVEFHYPAGPFTLVPAGEARANLVWIDEKPVLSEALSASTESLEDLLYAKSQRLFGRNRVASPAAVFPLSTLTVSTAGKDSLLLVGEAAHAFPPIGAQGLNLGLRDVADFATALSEFERSDGEWAQRVAADYARRRSGDLLATGSMVDALFRSLLADFLPAQALRAGGLWALKLAPGLRKQAFRMGMGTR